VSVDILGKVRKGFDLNCEGVRMGNAYSMKSVFHRGTVVFKKVKQNKKPFQDESGFFEG
jgi:hypothetical protein